MKNENSIFKIIEETSIVIKTIFLFIAISMLVFIFFSPTIKNFITGITFIILLPLVYVFVKITIEICREEINKKVDKYDGYIFNKTSLSYNLAIVLNFNMICKSLYEKVKEHFFITLLIYLVTSSSIYVLFNWLVEKEINDWLDLFIESLVFVLGIGLFITWVFINDNYVHEFDKIRVTFDNYLLSKKAEKNIFLKKYSKYYGKYDYLNQVFSGCFDELSMFQNTQEIFYRCSDCNSVCNNAIYFPLNSFQLGFCEKCKSYSHIIITDYYLNEEEKGKNNFLIIVSKHIPPILKKHLGIESNDSI